MIMHVYIAVVYCNRLLAKKLTVMTLQKMCLVCSSRLLKNYFKEGDYSCGEIHICKSVCMCKHMCIT